MMFSAEKEFYRIINSISIIGIYIYQKNGKIVFCNRAFAKMLGYTKSELKKLTLFDIVSKDKSLIAEIVKRRTKGEKFSREYNELFYKTKNGLIKPTMNFGYTINFKGKPAGLVVVIDITKQKIYSSLYESLANMLFALKQTDNPDDLLEKVKEILMQKGGFEYVTTGKIKGEYYQFKERDCAINSISINTLKNCAETINNNGNLILLSRSELKKLLKPEKNPACLFTLYKNRYAVVLFSRMPRIFTKEILNFIKSIQDFISQSIEKMELTKWKRLLDKAIEQSFDLIVITDKNLKILYANKNVECITQSGREELLNKGLDVILGKETVKEILEDFNRDHAAKNIYRIVSCKNKEDKEINLLLNMSKLDMRETVYIITGKNISTNKKLQMAIEEIAKKDKITGLLNRDAFLAAIEKFIKRAKHKNLMGAVAVINPINFSKLNRALGFKKSNLILKQIADRLINFLREYDTIAKLESDRFGILLKDINREEDIFVIIKRLLENLFKPYRLNGKDIPIGFNAGISIFPSDSQDAEELVEKAEIAIPQSRELSVNFGFYQDSIRKKFTERLNLETSFYKALKNDEFTFVFQPYIEADSCHIAGAESLIRWEKDEKVVPPLRFIPALEEMNLIKDLETWIIENKLTEFEPLLKKEIPVAINISPSSLSDNIFVEKLIKEIERREIDPSKIRLEITERLFLENLDRATKTLKRLKEIGFSIMVDDFGTGYSSLSYLSKLPIDYVKIDISFTRNITKDKRTTAVVKTIIFIAKELGIKTIAEGVETKQQARILKEMGCNYLQGFYFYKPMRMKELLETLNTAFIHHQKIFA